MKRHACSVRRLARGASIIALLVACGGGGGTSDKDQITRIIKAYGAKPTLLCTQYATPFMIKAQFVSKANCLAAASSPGAADPKVKVDSVSVKGKTATAIRTSESNPGKGTKATMYFVKTRAGWKIDAVIPRKS